MSGHPHSIVSPVRPVVGVNKEKVTHVQICHLGTELAFVLLKCLMEQSLHSANLEKLTPSHNH